MRIAVAKEGNMISEHFGHCKQFVIYDVEGTKIAKETIVDNPGHQPGFLPVFLKEKGVTEVISGGMGRRAIDLFAANGIKTITGATGPVKDVVAEYLAGRLIGTGEVCQHHEEHQCEHD